MAQPYRHPTSGRYYLRRKVPAELRAALGYEFKRSLETQDPAEARARFAAVWSDSERAFSLARAGLKGDVALSQSDILALAERWFADEVQKLERSKSFERVLAVESTGIDHEGEEYALFTALRHMDPANEDDLSAMVAASAKDALRARSVPVPPLASAAYLQLQAAFRERLLALSDFAMKRYEGDWLFKPDVAERQGRAEPPLVGPGVGSNTKRLLDVFELYAKDKLLTDGDTRATRRTVDSYRSIVRRFIELNGDLPLVNVDRSMILLYREQLAKTPAKGNGIRALNASQLIEKAKSEKLPLLDEATIRNRLRALSAVLSFGVRQGFLRENPIIASGIGRAAAKAATRKAARSRGVKDYTAEELQKIFSSAIYSDSGWEPPRANFGRAWYWLPLLMYYTGARREELAQLRVSDVRVSSEGIHYLDILNAGDEGDGSRGVKTESSRRVIPLHSDILRRGFLSYRDSLPAGGSLFPKLKASPGGYFGTNFGKRWAEYLRITVGLTTSASPSHGFRHTFKTLCRAAGIPEDVQDAITGHVAVGRVARSYGRMPLATMSEAMGRFPTVPALPEVGAGGGED